MSIVTDSEKVAHCAFKRLLTLLCDFHESWRAVTFLYLWIMFYTDYSCFPVEGISRVCWTSFIHEFLEKGGDPWCLS